MRWCDEEPSWSRVLRRRRTVRGDHRLGLEDVFSLHRPRYWKALALHVRGLPGVFHLRRRRAPKEASPLGSNWHGGCRARLHESVEQGGLSLQRVVPRGFRRPTSEELHVTSCFGVGLEIRFAD